MVKGKDTVRGGDGPSNHTRSKKTRTPPQKSPSIEVRDVDNHLLTDEQRRDVEMEAKFRTLITAGLDEAIPTIIAGTTEALKKGKAIEGGASQHLRSRKTKSKTASKDKRKFESEYNSEHSSYHDSSPSFDGTVDKPKDRKEKKKVKSVLSGSKSCT
jgi:hypothetical protein